MMRMGHMRTPHGNWNQMRGRAVHDGMHYLIGVQVGSIPMVVSSFVRVLWVVLRPRHTMVFRPPLPCVVIG